MIRNAWYAVGLSEDFAPRKLEGQVVTGRPIVLWRAESGEVVALDACCAQIPALPLLS